MKTTINLTLISLIAIVALTGCGKGTTLATPVNPKSPGLCYDVTNGNWQDLYKANHQLVLNDQCQGATTYCNEVFTYHPQPNGTIILAVTATNGGPECLPIGATTCTASTTSGVPLSIDCGAGKALSSNYSKL